MGRDALTKWAVIGYWRLLYPGRSPNGQRVWLCQCQCLTIREVREDHRIPPSKSRVWRVT